MTPDRPEDEGEVEIVYSYAQTDPDDPSSIEPRTKKVSADWYEAVQHADEVLQQVKDDWIRKSGIRSVGLRGDDSSTIVVTVDRTNPEVREQLPDSVEEVPIRIRFTDPSKGEPL
jgi:hypothetical protein